MYIRDYKQLFGSPSICLDSWDVTMHCCLSKKSWRPKWIDGWPCKLSWQSLKVNIIGTFWASDHSNRYYHRYTFGFMTEISQNFSLMSYQNVNWYGMWLNWLSAKLLKIVLKLSGSVKVGWLYWLHKLTASQTAKNLNMT